jgi:hypothetical protein
LLTLLRFSRFLPKSLPALTLVWCSLPKHQGLGKINVLGGVSYV